MSENFKKITSPAFFIGKGNEELISFGSGQLVQNRLFDKSAKKYYDSEAVIILKFF